MKQQGLKIGAIIGTAIAGLLLGLALLCSLNSKMEMGFMCVLPFLPTKLSSNFSLGHLILHFGIYILIGSLIGWTIDKIRLRKKASFKKVN